MYHCTLLYCNFEWCPNTSPSTLCAALVITSAKEISHKFGLSSFCVQLHSFLSMKSMVSSAKPCTLLLSFWHFIVHNHATWKKRIIQYSTVCKFWIVMNIQSFTMFLATILGWWESWSFLTQRLGLALGLQLGLYACQSMCTNDVSCSLNHSFTIWAQWILALSSWNMLTSLWKKIWPVSQSFTLFR